MADPTSFFDDVLLKQYTPASFQRLLSNTNGHPEPAPQDSSKLCFTLGTDMQTGQEVGISQEEQQQGISDRIEFIRNGKYAQFFGVEAVLIAYVIVGSRSQSLSSRLSALCAWTKEILTDLELEKWKNVFYFTSLVYEDLYNLKHFSDPVWYTPSDQKPRRLLEA